jgi:hypothetical protein
MKLIYQVINKNIHNKSFANLFKLSGLKLFWKVNQIENSLYD